MWMQMRHTKLLSSFKFMFDKKNIVLFLNNKKNCLNDSKILKLQ